MAQQMSDDQVIQYVKEANKSGKSQKQITTELLRRGVTKEQVSRIQQKYSESNTVSNKSNEMPSQLRQRTLVDDGGGQRRTTDYSEVGMFDETVGGRVDNRADNTAITDNASQIFGHDVFTNRNLTFAIFVPFFHKKVKDIIQSLDYIFIYWNCFIKKLHTSFPHEIHTINQAVEYKRFVLYRVWTNLV